MELRYGRFVDGKGLMSRYSRPNDGAIHQPLNRSLNEIAGCFKQPRGASDKRIQGWGDDLLRQQSINHDQKLTLRHERIYS